GDRSALSKAEDLISAAIGQDQTIPPDESMQTAASCNQLVAWTEIKVIGVPEDDLCACLFEIAMTHRFHGALGADRHEGRRLYPPMRRRQLAATRMAVSAVDDESERTGRHATISSVRAVRWLGPAFRRPFSLA